MKRITMNPFMNSQKKNEIPQQKLFTHNRYFDIVKTYVSPKQSLKASAKHSNDQYYHTNIQFKHTPNPLKLVRFAQNAIQCVFGNKCSGRRCKLQRPVKYIEAMGNGPKIKINGHSRALSK